MFIVHLVNKLLHYIREPKSDSCLCREILHNFATCAKLARRKLHTFY